MLGQFRNTQINMVTISKHLEPSCYPSKLAHFYYAQKGLSLVLSIRSIQLTGTTGATFSGGKYLLAKCFMLVMDFTIRRLYGSKIVKATN